MAIRMDEDLLTTRLFRAVIQVPGHWETLLCEDMDNAVAAGRARAHQILWGSHDLQELVVIVVAMCPRCAGSTVDLQTRTPCRKCDGSGVRATVSKERVRRADVERAPLQSGVRVVQPAAAGEPVRGVGTGR